METPSLGTAAGAPFGRCHKASHNQLLMGGEKTTPLEQIPLEILAFKDRFSSVLRCSKETLLYLSSSDRI